MSKENLGKVLITPKGEWTDSMNYEKLDIVSYHGGSWIAKRENTGITPVDGDDWTNIANITKDGVVDALGYEPQEQEGDWVLLESVTTTEKTTVERTEEPDGTPYKLRALYVVATTTTKSFTGGRFWIKTAQLSGYKIVSYYWGTTTSSSWYMQSHKFVPDHSRYEIYTSVPDTSGAYANVMRGWGRTEYGNSPFEIMSSAYPITGFKSENIPAGTLTIYGIRKE